VLAQRLKQLEQFCVLHIEPKPSGKGHLYRLTPAGEDFRSIIELLSVWGQRWDKACSGPMILIPKNSSGVCVGRSTQQKYRRRASSSASISAVYPNPIAARATGGYPFYFCQLEAIETLIWWVEATEEFRQGIIFVRSSVCQQRLVDEDLIVLTASRRGPPARRAISAARLDRCR
jgi:HxlR-like helix-turn-helix